MPESYSDRGFAQYATVPETHGGEVHIYESSSAEGPHCWLAIEGRGPVGRCAGIPFGVAPAHCAGHLSVEQATAVRDALDEFIAQHGTEAERE